MYEPVLKIYSLLITSLLFNAFYNMERNVYEKTVMIDIHVYLKEKTLLQLW